MSKDHIDEKDLKGVSGGAGFTNLDGGTGSGGADVGSKPGGGGGGGGGGGNQDGFDPEGESGGIQELE